MKEFETEAGNEEDESFVAETSGDATGTVRDVPAAGAKDRRKNPSKRTRKNAK